MGEKRVEVEQIAGGGAQYSITMNATLRSSTAERFWTMRRMAGEFSLIHRKKHGEILTTLRSDYCDAVITTHPLTQQSVFVCNAFRPDAKALGLLSQIVIQISEVP